MIKKETWEQTKKSAEQQVQEAEMLKVIGEMMLERAELELEKLSEITKLEWKKLLPSQ